MSAIFIASFFHFGFSFFLLIALCAIACGFYRKFFARSAASRHILLCLAIFLAAFSLGTLCADIKHAHPEAAVLSDVIGAPVSFSGVIVREPRQTDSRTQSVVHISSMNIGSSTKTVSAKILVGSGLYPELAYGDFVSVHGTLERPKNFSSFDYRSYLAKDDIVYQVDFASVAIVSHGNGNRFMQFLFSIKNAFLDRLRRTIHEPEAGLASGILLGTDNALDASTTAAFRSAGLSHIVALSGYNITIVASAIARLFSFLPKIYTLSLGALGIVLFVLMSGSSATALRAGIMALVVILAQASGRKYQIGRALLFAALVMVLANPDILVFDLSFQLSFLATVAIVYIAPILERSMVFLPVRFGIRNTVASTLAAELLVTPLVLHSMGMLSLVAVLANLFVLFLIPAVMLASFCTGLLGLLWLPLSLPFAWIAYALLAYIIAVVAIFAQLPFSSISITWFSSMLMILSYACIGVWFFSQKHEHA